MEEGKGFAKLYPALNNNSIVDKINEIPCIINHGITDSASLIKMLPMPQISDVEITNIINYIVQDLNNSQKEMHLIEVQNLLADCNSKNQ